MDGLEVASKGYWEGKDNIKIKDAIMNFEELLEKYQALLVENSSLKEEIENLNTKLGLKVGMMFMLNDGKTKRRGRMDIYRAV